jgi:hypothetical protein
MQDPHSQQQTTEIRNPTPESGWPQQSSPSKAARQTNVRAGWYHDRPNANASATCPNGQTLLANTKTFPLQNQLIFETIPLTAEAPVSRPW